MYPNYNVATLLVYKNRNHLPVLSPRLALRPLLPRVAALPLDRRDRFMDPFRIMLSGGTVTLVSV